MKKLFFYITFFATLGLSAQSLEVQDAPEYIQFDPQVSFLETGLTIYNQSDSAVAVVAERVDNQVSGPQYNFFCWDVCYGATVNRSIGAIRVRSEKSTDAFTLTFHPEGDGTPVQVTMRFYNRDTPSDYVEHTFHFATSATPIEEETSFPSPRLQLYPNPANSFTQFRYELPPQAKNAQIILYNLIGRKLTTVSLSSPIGEARLPLEQYPAGIYMISLVEDGKLLATRRLVIKR